MTHEVNDKGVVVMVNDNNEVGKEGSPIGRIMQKVERLEAINRLQATSETDLEVTEYRCRRAVLKQAIEDAIHSLMMA